MNAQALLNDLRGRGVELWLDGPKLRYKAPAGAMSNDLRQAVGLHRAEIIATLSAPVTEPNFEDFENFGEGVAYPQDAWDWFDHISLDDARYIATKPKQELCPWCKRRTGHTSDCNEMHAEWSAIIPWGKYKGKTVVEVAQADQEYLRWLRKKTGLSAELKNEIERILNPIP